MIAFYKNSDIQKWFEAKNMPKSNSTQNDEIGKMEKAIDEGFAESERDLKDKKTPLDQPTQNDWEKRYEEFITFVTNEKNWIDGRPVWKEYKYVTLANAIKYFIRKELADARREVITGETSDGYHTFNELYEFRKLFNALLFNEWAKQGLYDVHKSLRHSDGEKCFGGGWFIVMAKTPEGQISNHYELKDWDLFKVQQKVKAEEWDGHTAKDVVRTLKSLATLREEESK